MRQLPKQLPRHERRTFWGRLDATTPLATLLFYVMLTSLLTPILIIRMFAALFLAILFLQSGLDKITDRAGNLSWLTEHFSKSPLASTVKPMFLVITILEVSTGVLSALGVIQLLLTSHPTIAFWGAVLAATSLTSLFFGQRVAKDYVGAATLVPYFLLALAAIWVLGVYPGSVV